MTNDIQQLLADLGIIDIEKVSEFFPRVRDNSQIKVYRCEKSGVIFLKDSRHIRNNYYTEKENLNYWSAESREEALRNTFTDDYRRYKLIKGLIKNKKYLDIGTGLGGILELAKTETDKIYAVEPQKGIRNLLQNNNYNVYKSVSQIHESLGFNVVSLFHVLEHLTDPLEELQNIKKHIVPGGKLIVEVPNARDFLISFLQSEPFKKFTFWSEHLILHTRESLEILLREAGCSNVVIKGCQRYPLANHLHWLVDEKHGGHQKWNFLNSKELDMAYENKLSELDMTDTLIAFATV